MKKNLIQDCRNGYTLIEILVAIGIIGILIGLLLVAGMKAREAGVRTQSMNNLKQISLATLNYAVGQGGKLPTINGKNPNLNKSLFVALLPFVEQEVLQKYTQDSEAMIYPRVAIFISPADPTYDESVPGTCSYAANAQVFINNPSLAMTYKDGASNTIAFAEHYSGNCSKIRYFYSLFQASLSHRPTFADGGPYVDQNANCGDYYPITSATPFQSSGAWGSPPVMEPWTFQAAPKISNCNPGLAQTPHSLGMVTGMGDGSVRILSPTISSQTYWGAVTPNKGEVLDNHW